MTNVIPFFRGIEGLPVNEVLTKGWRMIRALDDNLHGIAEVKGMYSISTCFAKPHMAEASGISPAELLAMWSPGPMPIEYEGGIDYEPAVQPVETDGLAVTEFTHKKDGK